MRTHGRSQALFAVDGSVERPSGRRKFSERLAAGHPIAELLPVRVVRQGMQRPFGVLHRQPAQSIYGGQSSISDTGDLPRRQYRDTRDPTLPFVNPGYFEEQQMSAFAKRERKKRREKREQPEAFQYVIVALIHRCL